jgi:hypothetical protein
MIIGCYKVIANITGYNYNSWYYLGIQRDNYYYYYY